jgi:hypothetical protein
MSAGSLGEPFGAVLGRLIEMRGTAETAVRNAKMRAVGFIVKTDCVCVSVRCA